MFSYLCWGNLQLNTCMKKTTLFSGLTLLASVCLLTGCSSSSEGDGSVTVVQKDGTAMYVAAFTGNEKKITVPLSDLVESCELIRFDESDDALFRAWVTTVTDNYIGIRQSGAPFKLFDRTGKFLGNVGAIGQGPGEYSISIYDEVINEKSGRILFTQFINNKIMMYDLERHHIKDIPLATKLNKPKVSLSDKGVISLVHMPFENDKAIALQIDTDGKVLAEYPASNYMRASNYDGEIFSYRNSNAFDFHNTSMDTIYHYVPETNKLAPVFTMQFPSGYTFAENWIHTYMELPDRFFINMYNYETKDSRPLMVSKKDKTTSIVKIVNDFYGHMAVPMAAFNKGYFILNLEPGGLLERIEKRLAEPDCSQDDKDKLVALAATLDENSNNLLFFGKLKQ